MSNYTYTWNGSYYTGTGSTIALFGEILPQLEQTALQQQIQAGASPNVPKIFVDPSDTTQAKVSGQYAASYIPGAYFLYRYISNPYSYSYNNGGVFSEYSYSYTYNGGPSASTSSYTGKKKPMSQIFQDGLSNTLLVSEQVASCGGGYNTWYANQGIYTEYLDYGGGQIYSYGYVGFKSGVTYDTCSSFFSSYLMTTRSGGVQIALADGSVRPVSPTISSAMAQNLFDPADGNVVILD